MTNQLAITSREQVNQLAAQYLEFLPGARDLPPEGRLALAHIAMAHGLDPFLKECWAIPVRDKQTKQIIGFELMIGITGWRRTAHDSREYWGRRFEQCTDEERKWLRASPNDLAQKCIIMRRKTGQQPMEFDGYGVYRQGEMTKMDPLHCVRLRAERDALKAAFPISLAGAFGARVRVVDEESGEIIDGDFGYGPEQPVEPESEPIGLTGETQSHPPLEAEVSQAPVGVQPEPESDKPANIGTPKAAKSASIAASVLIRWRQAAQALADEFPYYRYENGEPNRYRILSIASQMNYREINESNIDAALTDLRQHAREQTQEVPQEA